MLVIKLENGGKMHWNGRIDGDDIDVLRIHQIIEAMSLKELIDKDNYDEKKVCFVSFNSDEGVRRNCGRLGAKEGWMKLKKALSNFPVFDTDVKFYDLSTPIDIIDNDLESAQEKLSETVKELKNRNYFVICLGGGHDIAYGTYNGVLKTALQHDNNPKIGIISFDAHFDMRSYEKEPTSGTMFLQIGDDCKKNNINFDYNVIGIQKLSNTKRLFDTAKKYGVNYYLAENLYKLNDLTIYPIIQRNDYIYLTLCTDVFNITCAPGVSAPQSFGIMPDEALRILKLISQKTKNLTLDVAEISPKYDYDDRTSRLMAGIIYQIILYYFNVSF